MVSREDSGNVSDQLQVLIKEYLEAEMSGKELDRNALIAEHPELADGLQDFFEGYDRERSAIDTPTLDSGDFVVAELVKPPSGDGVTAGSGAPEDTPTMATTPRSNSAIAPNVHVKYFGDYELLKEIARGGMGVVYQARQRNLNRTVALKMILSGQFAGEEDVQRFRTEAESAAQLDHPGIVPIFEIGQHEGQHYFSMGYVEGNSLAEQVRSGPLSPREAAKLVQRISEAMAYAHRRGVIHRDLKPANILIDANGAPKITDFGLAKKTEADSDLTGTGQILGTPAYMPPEQASGKADEVGPLADVYSMGAILYCLLTGRPPFQAANPMDTLLQVLNRDPVPVRQLVPTVPRDLDTICNKCLSKDPAKRYASAEELSADLQRFLDDEPIQARPAGRIERAAKWASKQPTIAAILLTMPAWLLGEPKIGVGLLALIAGFHLPFRFRFIRLLAVLIVAVMAAATIGGFSYLFAATNQEASGSMARMAAISVLSSSAPLGVVIFVFLWDCISQLKQPRRKRGRWWLFASAFGSMLCIGGFFYYISSHTEQVSAIVDLLESEIMSLTTEVQSDGEETASSEVMMQLFRSRMVLWFPVITGIVWLYLVLGIVLGRLIHRFVYVTHRTPRGKVIRRGVPLVKSVDGDVSRWVAITAAVLVTILPYGVSMLLSIYDVRMMQAFELGNPLGSIIWVIAAAWLAAYAVDSRRQFMIASVIGICLAVFLGYRTADAIEANRRRLGPDGLPGVAVDESMIAQLKGHTGPVKSLAISPNGRFAASASGWPKGDGTVRVWNLRSGDMLWVRNQQPGIMMTVSFSSDGQRVVAGRRDGMVFVWETATARELNRFRVAKTLEGLVLVAGDAHCITAGEKVQEWNLETGELVREFKGIEMGQLDISLSADGRRIATGGWDKKIHVWDVDSAEKVATHGVASSIESLSLNPDGSHVFVGLSNLSSEPRLVRVLVDDSSKRVRPRGHNSTVNWVRHSPDGRNIITASRDRTVRIWDAESCEELEVFRGHQDWVWAAVFMPDGQHILSAGGGRSQEDTGRDWSLRTWNTGPPEGITKEVVAE